ncbi:XRE family transcriptional regulator [Pandoraea capi]|uniref:XRE family transcriptional regulator n=1 Tax=Pandoraea capi TaxID=2508286 RepID=A0ABY6W4W7_9BURK|nr:cupin domain-containing protein [Pandoraea capi]VVE26514.1 XRE family transcriptional regulator [Pandoraea capi]
MAKRQSASSSAAPGHASGSGGAGRKTAGAPGANDSLGLRLKHARLVRQLTLKALAELAGCSESLLSKVERANATPSLATLHRIAHALDTNIGELVSGPDLTSSPVHRSDQRPVVRFPTKRNRGSIMLERVVVPGQGQLLQGDIHVIEPNTSSDEQISHIGEELGYVIEGTLELMLGEERHVLRAGDSFHFPSTLPHSYRNPGETVTRVLWINTPPTF